jgi:hypothetical protein
MTMFRIVLITLLIGATTWGTTISTAVAQQTEGEDAQGQATAEDAAPTGLAVDGIIRSTRGGFAFPNGARMIAPPKLALGGPFECAPSAGESRSCAIAETWDLCSLSGMAMSRFNAFVEPSCLVVHRGNGSWSIDVESSGQFVIRCQATCLRLGS